MKKSVASKAVTVAAGLSVLCLLTLVLVGAAPSPAVDAIKVIVNGKDIRFPDAQPFIDSNGRTQVPMRFVAEAMGAEVEWTQSAERVDIARGRIRISLTIDVKEIVVLNVKKPMDTAPILQESRTFVPLRFVSEGFGASVEWVSATRTVYINDVGRDSGDKYKIGDFLIDIDPNDKVGLSTLDLLSVYKESGLVIGEWRLNDDGSAIDIQIKVDNPATDIPQQRKETEALLKQCLSEKLANEIMAYAAQKENLVDKLDTKIFKEGRYEVVVGGGVGPLMIRINMR